jgi:enoyl-CoA hydratase/carnithine racemase
MATVDSPSSVTVSRGATYVAVVQLDNPPHNLIDRDTLAALADAFDAVDADPAYRASVLTATGKVFSGGANVSSQAMPVSPAEFYAQALRLFGRAKPVVAAVHGPAVGGGLGLALAADFRVAAPEARFTANFARLGFHHGFGLTVTLPAVVGQQSARDLLLTGRSILGEEAHALGLCDRLVPADELLDASLALAGELAGSAPLAVASIRETLVGDLQDRVRQAVERESAEQQRLLQTSDFQEGVRAMKERRLPEFEGR